MQTRSSLQRRTNSEHSDRVVAHIKPRSWGDEIHEQPQAVQPKNTGFDFKNADWFSHDPGPRSPVRVFNSIQAKLTVGAPNDVYEQEADLVAEQVMSTPDSAIQQPIQREAMPEEEELQMKPLAATITPLVQREAMPEEEEELQTKSLENSIQREALPEEEEELQAKSLSNSIQREAMPEEEEGIQTKRLPDAGFQADSNLENRLNSSQDGGSPLSEEVRSFMEPRFGADFSQVRVHTGSESVQMNQDLNAQAFTHGQDVYFGSGKSPGNDALTAHELTHVLQQNYGLATSVNPKIQKRAGTYVQRRTDIIQRQDEATLGMTVSNQVSDGPYGWTSSYALEISDRECTVTVNVKVNPDPGVTAQQVARVKSVTANEFARYYDSRFNLVDAAGDSRSLRVRLNYVDSGEHLTVALHAGEGRNNLSNWFVVSDGITRAHEMGHQLGLKDEYVDATVPNRATATSPGVSDDHSLMGNYYTQGIGSADVRQRHGDQLASDISSATGMSFTAEFSNTYIVRQGDFLSSIALRIYNDAARWQDIYNLNRDKIQNPNLIFPGQELQLPPRSP